MVGASALHAVETIENQVEQEKSSSNQTNKPDIRMQPHTVELKSVKQS